MASETASLDDLGDGIVVGQPNPDGRVTISDKETGATLGTAQGATPDALAKDMELKVGRIRDKRAAVVKAEEEADHDWKSGRQKAIAALKSKSTPAAATADPAKTEEVKANG